MPPIERTFDTYLGASSQSELKSIARIWGARSTQPLKKDALIAIIKQGLADPERVRAAIEILTPLERAALALMRWAGEPLEAGALVTGLRAGDMPLPTARSAYEQDSLRIIQPLIRRGLLLNLNLRDPSSPGSSYERPVLFSDARLLEHAELFQPTPLPLTPAHTPEYTLLRRPPTIALDVARVLQTLQTLGKLNLTKQGTLRMPDMRRLAKALGWGADSLNLDGLPFPQPAAAFAAALESAKLLAKSDDALALSPAATDFAQQPYVEQVRTLLHGFLRANQWAEVSESGWYFTPGERFTRGRLALIIALLALPAGSSFFTISDFEHVLFARIGEHFSLSYDPHQPHMFSKDPQDIERAEQQWRKQMRAEWVKHERPWVTAALTTWLYFLGIVELGFTANTLVSIRLTELGRAALSPDAPAPVEEAMSGPVWLVQPDFEVVVYLDQAAPRQIAFIEQHAERIQAEPHVARYRLTRESVYQGLERGSSLDALLAGLQAGAAHDLPQNVAATIREWAARRDQITLHRRAQLIEFPSQTARQQALDGGLNGAAVGERFVVITMPASKPLPAYTRIDYTLDLPRCLAVSEDGIISQSRPTRDLLLHRQLDLWTTAQPDATWQLSSASVAQAIRNGASISQLIELLRARLTHALPALLAVVLRAWAGSVPDVALANVTLLRCSDPIIFAAITGSAMLKPYFLGALAPDLMLVDPGQVSALRERLEWAGLGGGTTIQIVKR